ncbi:hypothetical protein CDO52_18200 [Nocardiopsis gilva YIM 90087]|uniref:Uncharacterized protein n=1 Tax=Nocardiopsis gilva YIM 90087 TaxID=1235441 RepID=A0A223S8P1_9ACTN|nr:hypothetical protein [Nocardiopsis gilva]ASU84476.1 hypothetical protein CDO52_18200 [Nocardiopsis gilva YIM 90087]
MTISITRLSWFELKRLLRGPFVWLGVLGIVALQGQRTVPGTSGELPSWGVITDSTILVGEGAAVAMFLAGLFPAARNSRYGDAITSPVGQRERSVALLTAVSLCGVALGALAWGVVIVLLGSEEVAGSLSPVALATPPLIAASGGVAGVLTGTWTKSWVPGLVPTLALPMYLFAGGLFGVESVIMNAPAAGAGALYYTADTLLRPSTDSISPLWGIPPLHAAQLLLLIAAGCAATVLRTSSGRRHRIIAAGLTVLLLGGVAVAHTTQRVEPGAGDTEVTAMPDWVSVPKRVCRSYDGVTYCSYATYESSIPEWRKAVAPVTEAVPKRARGDLPTVALQTFEVPQQTVMDGVAVPFDRWSLSNPWTQQDLTAQVAQIVLKLPKKWHYGECTLRGQARLPVYLWLLYRPVAHDPRERPSTVWGGDASGGSVDDIALAVAMHGAPDEKVIRALNRSWERVTAPETTSAEAARLLDIEVTDTHRASAERELDAIASGHPDADGFSLLDQETSADETADPPLAPCR